MNAPKQITMAELARLAEVSTATVSMSLNQSKKIPQATRDRILKLAQQHGYHPNPNLSALMHCRRKRLPAESRAMLALVNGLEHPEAWRRSPYPSQRLLLEGALARARELGYQPEQFWLHQDGMSPKRFSQMLRVRGISGLLMGPLLDDTPPPALDWESFCAVGSDVLYRSVPLHVVCSDHICSGMRIVNECQRLGYRRPGLVLDQGQRMHFQGLLEAGFLAAAASLPEVKAVPPLHMESFQERGKFNGDAFFRWLERRQPDVIVSLDAEFLERVLKDHGWRVPRDLGLASLECAEIGDRFSGICQQGRVTGATAINVLANLVERDERGRPGQPITTLIEGGWNPGQTLAPTKKATSVAPQAAERPKRRAK